MAILEQLGRMTYIDAVGDQHILYPVTKKECVDGLLDIEDSIGDLDKLETTNKSNLVAAINEARNTGSSSSSDIQDAINIALTEAKESGEFDGRGIVSIIRTAGNGAAGTVDTYTITYTDESTSIFNVYNGANGVSDGSGETDSGENGATFTPYVDAAGNLSWSNDKGLANPETVNIKGADGYTPQKGVDYFDGKDGTDGKDGYTPQKGVDYFDGEDGGDGISCTHFWDGTKLSITSASGTSSADLIGKTGSDGADGVSIVKVEQTTTSNLDGGTNVLTIMLSDGKTFTFGIKNGSKGGDGAQGATGPAGEAGKNASINGVNALTLTSGKGITTSQNGSTLTISANYEYGTEDLTAGTSALATGKLYFVYE